MTLSAQYTVKTIKICHQYDNIVPNSPIMLSRYYMESVESPAPFNWCIFIINPRWWKYYIKTIATDQNL